MHTNRDISHPALRHGIWRPCDTSKVYSYRQNQMFGNLTALQTNGVLVLCVRRGDSFECVLHLDNLEELKFDGPAKPRKARQAGTRTTANRELDKLLAGLV